MRRLRTNWNPTWIGALALLLTLGLPACSDDQTSPDGPIHDGQDGDGGTECAVICSTDADCCDGESCIDGICTAGDECPSGCNYECSQGQICVDSTCVTGNPPANCTSDCQCYAGETCAASTCIPSGGDETPCTTDADCEQGEICRDSKCRPETCQTREDCVAGGSCLVCKDAQCTAPPPVCQGDQDCCVGYRCNFGTCIPVVTGCQSDSQCTDPEFPRCVPPDCVKECFNDIDCPLPGQVCIDNECVSPGCTPESCAQGNWCDTGDGQCKPGCDSNDDCVPPQTCNYLDHQCGQTDCCGGICRPDDQYCDTLTCQCVDLCQTNADCPANYDCDPGTGKCMCTAAACPPATTCNLQTGDCDRDGTNCDPNDPNSCPAGQTCDPFQLVCVGSGSGQDGDPCFSDGECGAGLLCDSNLWCILCDIFDPPWVIEYVCRYECAAFGGSCAGGYDCKVRYVLTQTYMCIPTP